MIEFWRAWTRPEGQVAIIDDGHATSWATFWRFVAQAANLFADSVPPGQRVAVVGGNSHHTLIAHAAALLAGRSSVPMSPRSTADELDYLLNDADAGLVLAAPRAEAAARRAARARGIGHVLTFDGGPGDDFLSALCDLPESVDLDRTPEVPLLYTSGTSGRPKGTAVRWVHETGATVREFVAQLVDSVDAFPAGPHLVAGPLYHNGPLLALRMVLSGRTVVLRPKFDAEQFLADVAEHGAASTVVVPTHLRRLMSLPTDVRDAYDTSSLRTMILTGAACPPELKRQAIERFGPVLDEAYGGTESGTVCRISASEWLEHPGSVGRPTPNFDVVVVDDDGREVEPGTTGRLFFRDLTGRGIEYHKDEEKTRRAHRAPGVFTLGDVGHIDPEGYVHITGRAVDMVLSGGVNLYPAEAERVIGEHPDVDDVAVIGVPDEDMGEALLAIVVLRAGMPETFDPATLDEYCRTRLASHKCPRRYEIRDELPRTAMGKLNKAPLRDDYWGDRETIGS